MDEEKLIKTLNGMGYALNYGRDNYTDEFIKFASVTDGPIADLGCAFGHFTRAALNAGTGNVIANDLCEEHLRILFDSVTDRKQRDRLTLMLGNALELDIKPGSLAGILAANWLQFLQPGEVKKAFKLFHSWLQPGGKVVVITITTHHGLLRESQKLMDQRHTEGAEWPGLATKDMLWGPHKTALPQHVLFLDPDQLEREAKIAGLDVDMVGFIARTEHPQDFQLDGREAAGLVATKR